MKKIIVLLLIHTYAQANPSIFDKFLNYFEFSQQPQQTEPADTPPIKNKSNIHDNDESTNESSVMLPAYVSPLFNKEFPISKGKKPKVENYESLYHDYEQYRDKNIGYDPDLGDEQNIFDFSDNNKYITRIHQVIPETILTTIRTSIPLLHKLATLEPTLDQKAFQSKLTTLENTSLTAGDFSVPQKSATVEHYLQIADDVLDTINPGVLKSLPAHVIVAEHAATIDPLDRYNVDAIADKLYNELETTKRLISSYELPKAELWHKDYDAYQEKRRLQEEAAQTYANKRKNYLDKLAEAEYQLEMANNNLYEAKRKKALQEEILCLEKKLEQAKNNFEDHEKKLYQKPQSYTKPCNLTGVAGYEQKAWKLLQEKYPQYVRELRNKKRYLPQFRGKIVAEDNKKRVLEQAPGILKEKNKNIPINYQAPVGLHGYIPRETIETITKEENKKRFASTKNYFKKSLGALASIFKRDHASENQYTPAVPTPKSKPVTQLSILESIPDPALD